MQRRHEDLYQAFIQGNYQKAEQNGLAKLAIYYQGIFAVEENTNYYSEVDYERAKRLFVKNMMEKRSLKCLGNHARSTSRRSRHADG